MSFDRTGRESLDGNVDAKMGISSVVEVPKISLASLVIVVVFWKYRRTAPLFPRTLLPSGMTLGRRLRWM